MQLPQNNRKSQLILKCMPFKKNEATQQQQKAQKIGNKQTNKKSRNSYTKIKYS